LKENFPFLKRSTGGKIKESGGIPPGQTGIIVDLWAAVLLPPGLADE
jgi:hypothetical protein